MTDDPQAPTRFDPAEVEPRIMRRWLDSGLFHPEAEGTAAENFSIAIPPPNVTGALHMGHALNGSIQDALIAHEPDARAAHALDPRHRPRRASPPRRRSRSGCAEEGTSRQELGREAFVERVWEWRARVRRRGSSSSSSAWRLLRLRRASASRSTTATRAPSTRSSSTSTTTG